MGRVQSQGPPFRKKNSTTLASNVPCGAWSRLPLPSRPFHACLHAPCCAHAHAPSLPCRAPYAHAPFLCPAPSPALVPAPSRAPVPAPSRAPVPAPSRAPVHALFHAPVRALFHAPVRAPCLGPEARRCLQLHVQAQKAEGGEVGGHPPSQQQPRRLQMPPTQGQVALQLALRM
eukprot:1159635-Pelagomonas_calceolata.AAC.3